MFVTRRAPLATAALSFALFASPARAAATWQEMHETSDDVRLEIAPDGIATVQHHLRYRVVAGHFKTFEITGLDPTAQLAAEAVFKPEKQGTEVPARVETKVPGTARIVIDEGKGLGRGAYTVDLGYKLDLVATKMLSRDGAMWKLAWTAPAAPEGHDGARVVFDLPTAPTEPRLAGASESLTTLATLRRSAERDELELVRAHVPRGEAVTWAARIDPKSLPAVVTPDLRPPVAAEIAAPSMLRSNGARIALAIGFALLAAALAFVLREKQRGVRDACARRGFAARPVLPLRGASPFVYGVVATLSLAVLLWWIPLAGALLVVTAMALASHRAPMRLSKKRTPGVWRPIGELLPNKKPPGDGFDLGARRGRVALAALVVAVAALVFVLRPYVPQIALALPLFASTLLPLFLTGTRAQMAEDAHDLAARVLRPIRDALGSTVDLAHVDVAAIARVPGGEDTPDEVRLACAPKERTPGLRAIEIALATTATGGAIPEVFVRFDSGSAAADRVRTLAAPLLPGRTAEERVVRLTPDEPTAPATSSLVARLLDQLEERRNARAPRWQGRDRRKKHEPTLYAPLGRPL